MTRQVGGRKASGPEVGGQRSEVREIGQRAAGTGLEGVSGGEWETFAEQDGSAK